jgi:hypothetical protein
MLMNVFQKFNNWMKVKCLRKYSDIFQLSALFLFNCFLVLSKLTPELYRINPHDGAKYIESGRMLLIWGVRDLSWGPLVAFIYAPLHLIVGNSLNWFMLEAWAGNVILFGLLWAGIFLLARHLKAYISSMVIIGLLFSLIVFFPIIENQSDALFLVFSMLALLNLNTFRLKGQLKNLTFASLFVGLGVLCRVETILLVFPLLLFALIFNKKRHQWYKLVLVGITPIICTLLLYALISFLTLGFVDLGLGNKSFESFEMNQAFLPGSKHEQAYFSGEEIFGDHQNSVFKAVLNNPLAVGERALANVLKLPQSFLKFFGDQQGPIIFFFSLLGIFSLIKAKDHELLALLLVWPLHAFVSLIFLPRHIIAQISFVFIILAAIGITQFILLSKHRKPSWIFVVFSVLLVVISGLTQNKVLFTSAFFLFVIFLTKAMTDMVKIKALDVPYATIILFFMILMMLGSSFEFPARPIGKSAPEQAIHHLQITLPENSIVMAPTPIVPIAAKMESVGLPRNIDSTDGFISFLIENNVSAVYIDSTLPYSYEIISATLDRYPEKFTSLYESDDGSFQVFLTALP